MVFQEVLHVTAHGFTNALELLHELLHKFISGVAIVLGDMEIKLVLIFC